MPGIGGFLCDRVMYTGSAMNCINEGYSPNENMCFFWPFSEYKDSTMEPFTELRIWEAEFT